MPGLNIAPNAQNISVYRDPANNFWYINQYGQPTQVTEAQVQWVESQLPGNAGGYPAGQQAQQPNNQTVVVNQQPAQQESTSSGGMSTAGTALVTGLSAATGAALGTALTEPNYNYYHGIPYGVPVYRDAANNPYYNQAGGAKVYVNNSSEQNTAVMNQWNNQKHWNQQNPTQPVQRPGDGQNPVVQNPGQDQGRNAGRFGGGDDGNQAGGKLGAGDNGQQSGGRFGRGHKDNNQSGGGFGGGDSGNVGSNPGTLRNADNAPGGLGNARQDGDRGSRSGGFGSGSKGGFGGGGRSGGGRRGGGRRR